VNYLSIETSSNRCSITFYYKSEFICFDKENIREHSKLLAPNCKKIINDKMNEIDFIALSIGPGSYSGLKTACSFAKGLAYALCKPIIPVATFDGMNLSIKSLDRYYIALYSHKDYAFFQLYTSGSKIGKIECNKISKMKEFNIFGYGFNDQIISNNYFEIKPSSKNIGIIAMEKYNNRLSKSNCNDIQPVFLSVGEKI